MAVLEASEGTAARRAGAQTEDVASLIAAAQGAHGMPKCDLHPRMIIDTVPPMPETRGSSDCVTAADVEYAVRSAVTTLRGAEAPDWDAKAGSLEWDCWETVEHLADDLFSYAAQLGPESPPLDTHIPFVWSRKRPGGPANVIFADRNAGTAGLLQVLEAGGALLAAIVRTAPPTVRSHHIFGVADPEGFAAMGVVETLVHMHDVSEGLGIGWTPDADLCHRVLIRLFPHAPTDTDRWLTLLWATGRADIPGKPRLTKWRWHGAPRRAQAVGTASAQAVT